MEGITLYLRPWMLQRISTLSIVIIIISTYLRKVITTVILQNSKISNSLLFYYFDCWYVFGSAAKIGGDNVLELHPNADDRTQFFVEVVCIPFYLFFTTELVLISIPGSQYSEHYSVTP